jgi:hypothetical protein
MDAKQSEKRNVLRDLINNASLHDWDSNGNMVLWQDAKGKSISDTVLKAALNAIFQHFPNMCPTLDTIAKKASCRRRTLQRALAVLQAKDVLIITQERNGRGYKRNVYTILDAKLRYLAQQERLPLFDQAKPRTKRESHAPPEHAHAPPEHAHAPPRHLPRATDGALTSKEDTSKAPSDVQTDGALDEVRSKANRLARWVDCRRDDNRKLVAKIALLWDAGELPDDACEQVLESFRVMRERIGNPAAWLYRTLANQCADRHIHFEQLLARTAIPIALLVPAAGQATIIPEGSMKGR